jgi:hypothetical protein
MAAQAAGSFALDADYYILNTAWPNAGKSPRLPKWYLFMED